MKKSLNINKFLEWIIKILIILSVPSLTFLLSNRFNGNHICIGVIISFFIMLLIMARRKIIKVRLDILIISVFISMYMIKVFMRFSSNNIYCLQTVLHYININLGFDTLNKIVGLLSIPGLTFILYIVLTKLKKFLIVEYKNFSKLEKRYILIVLSFATIFAIVITTFTTAFTKPIYKNKLQNYDVIYTSDTGGLISGNTFFNVSYAENDIRQPLFGIMSLPFSVPAMIIGDFLFMLPRVSGYEFMLIIIQFFLIAITTVFLARLLKLNDKDKIIFYILFSVSYPYLLFSLVLEQYAIGLFWLIFAIYLYYTKSNKINYAYIGAVGTMLTSGVIFPLITKAKSFKKWLCDIFKCFVAFISITVIGGQLSQILTFKERLLWLSSTFSGKITFYDKFCQFSNFVRSIIFAPSGQIKTVNLHPSYQLIDINNISVIGIIILLIVFVGFYLNRHNKLAQISIGWVLFSFIILCLIGWGAPENGMILYSLYFSWAYLVLLYLFFKSIFKNKNLPIIIFMIIMLVYNIKELINIISFSVTYY